MQSNKQAFDVLIVGAGMVGSSLAVGLALQNLRVGLLDRALPKPVSEDEPPRIRVSAIHLASEQLLRNLGAWKYIINQRAFPYTYLAVKEMHARKGLFSKLPDISSWATTRFDAAEIGRTYLGHIIENDVIQNGLLTRVAELENITLLTGVDIQSSCLTQDERVLKLADGTELSANLVIGADGAQSLIRKLSGIGQSTDAYTQHAYVISVRYKGPQQEGTWQAFRPEGPLAFLPLPSVDGQQYGSLVWYDSAEKIKELKALDKHALRKAIQASYPPELPEITEVLSSASFPIVKSHAHQYWKERVVLAGDAAHTINPLAGQGVNLGFMDAAVLIEKLGKANVEGVPLDDPSVVSAYEQARRKYNQLMMNAMDAFYYGFSANVAPIRIARNVGLGLAQRSGPVKRKVVEYATGMTGEIPRLARVTD